MAKSKKEKDQSWMENLANKYEIGLDTVLGFYNSIDYRDRIHKMNKRQRTESFFELYFEGVKEGK